MRSRSSTVKNGSRFCGLTTTATVTSGKTLAARVMTSRCPIVGGSKLPG